MMGTGLLCMIDSSCGSPCKCFPVCPIGGFLEYPLHYVAEQKSGYSYGYRYGYSYGYSYGYIYTRHSLNHKELAPNTLARTYR